jgi:hypothetical protein
MLRIQQYAEDVYGLKLTVEQLELVTLIASGNIQLYANLQGQMKVAQHIVIAYLQDSLRKVEES